METNRPNVCDAEESEGNEECHAASLCIHLENLCSRHVAKKVFSLHLEVGMDERRRRRLCDWSVQMGIGSELGRRFVGEFKLKN